MTQPGRTDIEKCPECGSRHIGLVMARLKVPRITGHTHMTTCPITGRLLYTKLVTAAAKPATDRTPLPRKPAERRKFLARQRKV